MTTNLIQDRCMLASLNVSTWSGERTDKTAVRAIDQHFGSHKAGRFSKFLVDPLSLKPIKKISGEIRTLHYRYTVRWLYAGADLLTVAAYRQYMAEIMPLIDARKALVRDYCDHQYLPEIDAAKARLNGLFHESEYPKSWELLQHFHCAVKVQPLPAAGGFPLELTPEERQAMESDLQNDMTQAAQIAVQSLAEKTLKTVRHMSAKLKEYSEDSDGKKSGVFRDSLVDNVRQIAELLPTLNPTGDSRFDEISAEIKAKLVSIDAEGLRGDYAARQQVASDAGKIANDIASRFGV